MSRFGDLLKKSLLVTPPSLGFKPVAAPSKPRMVLVTTLPGAEVVTEAVGGADAVIVRAVSAAPAKALKAMAKALPGTPWGVWLESDGQNLKQADSAEADFVVFAPDRMTLAVMEHEKLGKVMAIEPTIEDSLLRTVGELPAEAVVLVRPDVNAPLTWGDLMLYRKLADMIAKPLLVPVAGGITATELKALWETGVDGVVVEAVAKTVSELRKRMESVSFAARRKWLKLRPLVPLIREEATPAPEEGEEEEDE